MHFFALLTTQLPGHARACSTLYLSDDAPADIRRRRILNTSCCVPRRMRARACLRPIGLKGHDYLFPADAKRG